MDGDRVSRVSEADEEDCRSDVSLASGTSNIRRDGILSRLDEGFQKSKSDLIQRFLLDQAELNRRFEEIGEDENANDNAPRDSTEDTLEETEKLLRRKLNLHGRTLGYKRSRTSMGFHNQAEFRSAPKDDSLSGSSDSEDSVNDYYTNRVIKDVCDVPYSKNDVPVRANIPPIVLQPILRPKTSVGRRRATIPQIIATENEYSYHTVPHSRLSDINHVAVHQSYPSSGHSDFGKGNPNFVPSTSLNLGINLQRNNIRSSKPKILPSVPKVLTVSYKKRKDSCTRGHVTSSDNVDSSKNVAKQRRKVHQRNQIQARDSGSRNVELNMSAVNGRRSSLVKLPPLDHTVSQTQKPLNSPCY